MGILPSCAAIVATAYWKREEMARLMVRDPEIQRNLVSLLSQPEFSGEEFSKQLLGSAELKTFFVDTDELQFRIPARSEDERSRFLLDSNAIRDRKDERNSIFFRPKTLRQEARHEDCTLFTTDLANFHVNPDTKLSFPYAHASFDITPRELAVSSRNIGVHGGKLYAYTGQRIAGRSVAIVNHGAFVAKPNHAPLHRFAESLVKDLPQDRERRIQRLTDLVTTEIAYDHDEADAGVETMKRPPEILMSRKSDCSNKAILLASLLEQIGVDYLLVYMHQHIAVAVERGAFPSDNGYGFTFQEKPWVLVETTARNFEIGTTRLQKNFTLHDMQYLQRPRASDQILDSRNGRPLLFQE